MTKKTNWCATECLVFLLQDWMESLKVSMQKADLVRKTSYAYAECLYSDGLSLEDVRNIQEAAMRRGIIIMDQREAIKEELLPGAQKVLDRIKETVKNNSKEANDG